MGFESEGEFISSLEDIIGSLNAFPKSYREEFTLENFRTMSYSFQVKPVTTFFINGVDPQVKCSETVWTESWT